MRVVFCGSGTFAVPVLRAILASEHELAAIITQPARPAGRGGKLRHTPVAELAQEQGLSVWECEDINAPASLERLGGLSAEVMCVVDFGQFIRQGARGKVSRSCFNLHAALLPELRGAAPINWAILRGLTRTGVTTFELVDKMDAGPIYLQESTGILPSETAEELKARLAPMGAELVCKTLGLLAAGWAQPHEQDHAKATRAPLLTKADGRVDWSADATAIRNRIHGAWPWPGGHACFLRQGKDDTAVILARCEVLPGEALSPPGVLDRELAVGTGSGRLRIVEIKPAGKRQMAWKDFVNGYRAGAGDRFCMSEHD